MLPSSMAQSKREADRCERQLKELLKLPENKRCPNCDSLVSSLEQFFRWPWQPSGPW